MNAETILLSMSLARLRCGGEVDERLIRLRITPACAGSRMTRVGPASSGQDHPRMRGEQTMGASGDAQSQGSPPHARGAAADVDRCPPEIGITPACAGSRQFSGRWPRRGRDHPRMRGEQTSEPSAPVGGRGSPPHARGAVEASPEGGGQDRITPACAGSSRCWPWPRPRRRDHPRMRGEQSPDGATIVGTGGSPPHARGADPDVKRRRGRLGITPACAGSRLPDLGR